MTWLLIAWIVGLGVLICFMWGTTSSRRPTPNRWLTEDEHCAIQNAAFRIRQRKD